MSYSRPVREWIELGLTEMAGALTVSVAVLRHAIAHATQSGHVADGSWRVSRWQTRCLPAASG